MSEGKGWGRQVQGGEYLMFDQRYKCGVWGVSTSSLPPSRTWGFSVVAHPRKAACEERKAEFCCMRSVAMQVGTRRRMVDRP